MLQAAAKAGASLPASVTQNCGRGNAPYAAAGLRGHAIGDACRNAD